jgi:hypothetical protein
MGITTTQRTSSGDLVVPRVIVTDPASVCVQQISDGFALWQGSWFLDTSAGFNWLLYMGQKILNANQLINAIQAFLLSVSGVVSIINVTAVFNQAVRAFSYEYAVTFQSGATITGSSTNPPSVTGGS